MGEVTGTLRRPDDSAFVGAVRFGLVDATGKALPRAFDHSLDVTYIGPVDADVSSAGVYVVDLPANTALDPAGTRWARTILRDGVAGVTDPLIVPVGAGPFAEDDILADPPAALPMVQQTQERDLVEIETDNDPVAITALTISPLDANTTVTVPDVDAPCWVVSAIGVAHSVANANVALALGPPGAGPGDLATMLGAAWGQLGAAGAVSTIPLYVRFPAHSPGDHQLYSIGTSGNVTLKGQTFAPSRLAVWQLATELVAA
jgi:hypothetical protein